MSSSILLCPVCQKELRSSETSKTYACPANHSYDVARQGYLNLLISNQKKTLSPGDSKEMVLARQAFLAKGFYDPLSDVLNRHLLENLTSQHNSAILDVGCGEGYYLSRLMGAADSILPGCSFWGLDVSKDAVKTASAAFKKATWIVGNSHRMPFKSKSFDCLYSIFSPIIPEECHRVLKNDGILIRVLPGTRHLLEMRQVIYPEVILNEEVDPWETCPQFSSLDIVKITYEMQLTTDELLQLVKMTPHYWKTRKENKKNLNAMPKLTVTVDMRLLIYKKTDDFLHINS